MKVRRVLLAAPVAAALLASCASQQTAGPASVADAIARDPQLSTLDGLVRQAGLAGSLQAAGPYTVFAPTNDAFKAVPAKTMAELGKDPAKLKALLNYHVLPGTVMAAQAQGKLKTTLGAELTVAKAGPVVTVEDAVVETADISASNGVVHKVDRVLMPPKR